VLLAPKNRKIALKHPPFDWVGYLDSKKQKSMTSSGQIRGAHEILGLEDYQSTVREGGERFFLLSEWDQAQFSKIVQQV